MCSKAVRCTFCTNWTDAKWHMYGSRRHLCKRKVGGLPPSGDGSALVLLSVQMEVHREQISRASQPRRYDTSSSGSDSSIHPTP